VSALLTAAAVLGLAARCQQTYAPETILAYAQGESLVAGGLLDAAQISRPNRDGSRDFGLMQINDRNFVWLGLTSATAMDPCRSIAAAETVLRTASGYNSGSPVKSVKYALAVVAREHAIRVSDTEPSTTPPAPDPAAPPAWDVWATQEYDEQKSRSPAPVAGDTHPDAAANSEASHAAINPPQSEKGKTNDAH
jgi:hypothetical protein